MSAIGTAKILEGLNPRQRQAVLHHEGPLLVIAGPGSGKTRVITHRLAYLMSEGVRPSHLLALTFTNKAAEEMRRRVRELTGHTGVLVGTFHGFCARVLRWYASLAGLKENFSIYDRDDSLSAMRQVLKQGGEEFRSLRPSKVLTAISKCKQDLLTPEDYRRRCSTDHRADPLIAEVYEAYQTRLQLANAVDFDDLLLAVVKLLADNEAIREELDTRFQFVMVDEYQDTNLAQFEIVRQLSHRFPNLMATGDPDQSIYGWRGATIRNILDFRRHYPTAKLVRLEDNYRSTPNILRVADTLIAYNTRRLEKTLRTDRAEGSPVRLIRFASAADEADAIAGRIAAAISQGRRSPRDFAVFYRANYLSRTLEQSLRRHGIPYQVVRGTEFYQRKEVRDLIAYLQLVYNPDCDEAFKRIVNVPARAIGKTTLGHLVADATVRGRSLMESARHADKIDALGKRAKAALQRFVELIDVLTKIGAPGVKELLEAIVERTGYCRQLEESGTDEDLARVENIRELIEDAAEFDAGFIAGGEYATPLEAFLQNAALTSDQDGLREDVDTVSLMTLHAAKGLEFPSVFIVAVEEGILPHERSRNSGEEAIEEERRLLFVGITRAKDELQLSLTRVRGVAGQEQPSVPSSFLRELPMQEIRQEGFRLSSVQFDASGGGETDWEDAEWDHDRAWDDEVAGGEDFDEPEIFERLAALGDEAARGSRDSAKPARSLPAGLVRASSLDDSAGDRRTELGEGEAFSRGTVVMHPEHGLGKVVGQGGSGRNATVQVQFARDTDPRSFRVAFAPLTVVRTARDEEVDQ